MKKIAVLLSSYNGENYIAEQVDSIFKQSNVQIDLYIRDDKSSDGTKQVLQNSHEKNMKVTYGEVNLGYGKSFLELVKSTPSNYDYYAFSDQDDFWEENKLFKAVTLLDDKPSNKLYFSNLSIVDNQLNYVKEKSFDNMKITVQSAFIRNRTAGCTYVFDNTLFKMLKKFYSTEKIYHVEHDSILYKLCLLSNGSVVYDKESLILYRQHNNNVTGTNQGFKKRFKKEFLNQINTEEKRGLMKNYSRHFLNFFEKQNYDSNYLDFLRICSSYDESLKNKIKLLSYSDMSSGVLLFDLKNKFEIIFNIY